LVISFSYPINSKRRKRQTLNYSLNDLRPSILSATLRGPKTMSNCFLMFVFQRYSKRHKRQTLNYSLNDLRPSILPYVR
jgi:hypothetical protein